MKKIFYFTALLFAMGCKGRNDPAPDLTIGKTMLAFPAPNEICTQGTIVSASQSKITFKWSAAKNADRYELTLKNLLKNETTLHESVNTEVEIVLPRNTPFAWSVVSKSSKNNSTSQSDIWKFYNSGPGITSYIPFPATIIAPLQGQNINAVNNKVTLKWEGNDVDGDISTYDVYLGTSSSLSLYKDNLMEPTLKDVPVVSGTYYYWKVITRDTNGNTSDSGEFQFKTN